MVQLRTLSLSESERADLMEHRDHDLRPQARERCAALLKIAEGRSPHWVAQNGLLKPHDPDTIYGWLNVYEDGGIDGLLGHLHGGARGPFRPIAN